MLIMPYRGFIRYFFARFMNEVGERRLAESYVMRRLAQLTIYQWTRLNEWAAGRGSSSSPAAIRIARRFVRNLQEEFKKLQGPGPQ